MSRRRLVITSLTCLLFASQLALVYCVQLILDPKGSPLNIAASVAAVAAFAALDVSSARRLARTLTRLEATDAAEISDDLERTLADYRNESEQDDLRIREVALEIDAELAKAREALAAGAYDQLSAHLRQGMDVASSIRPNPCQNQAIAAVLSSKESRCQASGIGFDPQVTLPEDIGMENVEAAAVFFNLIDNAIRACENLLAADPTSQPLISVRSRIQAGQLFVEVTNPYREQAGEAQGADVRRADTRGMHGWGTGIVTDIAQAHRGIARFERREGCFVASVLVPVGA